MVHFEALPNEVIEEIFDLLDDFHVYEVFFNLNQRFRSICTNSNRLIKINLSSMSKSRFQCYDTDIIIPNTHRIKLFRISNVFIDPESLLFDPSAHFPKLKTLTLDNIDPNYLINLLEKLPSLKCLSSLNISSLNDVSDTNIIYSKILSLRDLKHCKLSLESCGNNEPLPFASNEDSPIEHFVIKHKLNLDQLDSFLSYVPKLRRLSIYSLYSSRNDQTGQYSINKLEKLTHVFLKLESIAFDKFEQLVTNHFPSLQELYITAGIEYMNADRWKTLILSHMPNLRVFDIRLDFPCDDQSMIEAPIKEFTSQFWIEHGWFFEYQNYQTRYENRGIFFSTNPYRRKNYILYKNTIQQPVVNSYEKNLKSVDSVYIQSENSIINCTNYFPNVTNLIFEDGFTTHDLIATNLNRIIPLKQLRSLIIECRHLSLIQVIELLHFTPNLHTLKFKSMVFDNNDYWSVQQSETFQSVSSTNTITNMAIENICTLQEFQMLVTLCPRLEKLTINPMMSDIEPMIRFLFENTNNNTSHLRSLCLSKASNSYVEILNALIHSRTLPYDCMLKYIDSNLYLWW